MMTPSKPPQRADSKDPSFSFCRIGVQVSSGARGSVLVEYWGARQVSPPCAPPSGQTGAEPAGVPGWAGPRRPKAGRCLKGAGAPPPQASGAATAEFGRRTQHVAFVGDCAQRAAQNVPTAE